MANTLTDLIPDLYAALDIVSRELVGFIPAVNRSSSAERASLSQQVGVPVTQQDSASDITPGQTAPDEGDTTVTTRPITITKARKYPIRFTGEETQGLETSDTYDTVRRDRFAQGMRTLVNEIEGDLASEVIKSSRAYGTAGTTPFGTTDDLTDFAGVNQVLDDNGAPQADRQLVTGSAATFNLRGNQTGLLQKVNEAGTDEALRNGEFGQIHNLTLRNTTQEVTHTSGTVTDVTANANTVGTTAVDVETAASTGDISLNEGDVISFAGSDYLYVVSEDTSASDGVASTTINVQEPGLQEATSDGDAVSVESDGSDNYVANAGFHRNAIQLATRAPALPEGGDSADDRMVVQDPVSGLAFEIAMYRQYRQLYMEVAMVWGYAMTKEEHSMILLG